MHYPNRLAYDELPEHVGKVLLAMEDLSTSIRSAVTQAKRGDAYGSQSRDYEASQGYRVMVELPDGRVEEGPTNDEVFFGTFNSLMWLLEDTAEMLQDEVQVQAFLKNTVLKKYGDSSLPIVQKMAWGQLYSICRYHRWI